MKTMKRYLSILLALVVALAFTPAATLASDSGNATYLEQSIEPPAGYGALTAITGVPGGGVCVAAKHLETNQWALLSWSDPSAEPDVLPLAYEGNDIEYIGVAEDGSIVAALSSLPPLGNRSQARTKQDSEPQTQSGQGGTEGGAQKRVIMSMDDMKSTIVRFNPDGSEAGRFELSGMISGVKALNGGGVAVQDYQTGGVGVTVYDAGGKQLWQTSGSHILDAAVSGGTLYALMTDKLVSYDAVTGQKLHSSDLSVDASARLCAADGALYVMDVTGLYALTPEDGQLVKLQDALGNLYGDPDNGVKGLAYLPGQGVAALIDEGAGSGMGSGSTRRVSYGGEQKSGLLMAYVKQDGAAQDAQEFVISALRDSAKLRKAAGDFQKLHPELNVKLETLMAQDDMGPTDDHIRTLNTGLLAGKGGDVLVLDGLPMKQYAQKGILADLSALFEDVELLPGIREGSTEADGAMYAVPAMFSLDLLWGNKAVTEQLNSLTELSELALEPGQTPLSARSAESWVRLFYPASEPAFLDDGGKVRFDSPEFAQFLEALYQLYADQGELPPEELTGGGGKSASDIVAMQNGSSALYSAQVTGLMDLGVAYTISGGAECDFAALPTVSGQGRSYTPQLLMGVNAQSRNRALAEEFIRSMFTTESQQLEQMEGLPTVAPALDALIQEAVERSQNKDIMMMFSIAGGNPVQVVQPDEATLDKLRALCDALNTPIQTDETLIGFILDETQGFFSGSGTAEDAARAIEQRAWAYLNE